VGKLTIILIYPSYFLKDIVHLNLKIVFFFLFRNVSGERCTFCKQNIKNSNVQALPSGAYTIRISAGVAPQ